VAGLAQRLMVAWFPELRVVWPAHRFDVIYMLAGCHPALSLTHHAERVLDAEEPGVLGPASRVATVHCRASIVIVLLPCGS